MARVTRLRLDTERHELLLELLHQRLCFLVERDHFLKLRVRVSGKGVIRLLRYKQVAILAESRTERTFIDDSIRLQPQEAQHVWIAVEQQPDKLSQFVEHTVPLALATARRHLCDQSRDS